jgi:RNA polymerase sigma factor (TIGR02999 family)
METSFSENEQSKEVTQLLVKLNSGDEKVGDELVKAVYEELHKYAKFYMSRERPDHTLQPTALVHEAYLRLVKQYQIEWESRTQFYAVAAQMMRRILVDYARNRYANKRGGKVLKVSLDEAENISGNSDVDLVLLDEALTELAKLDPRQSQIVELRFFSGLSVEETAQTLNISVATVTREWRIAKMWLYSKVNGVKSSE